MSALAYLTGLITDISNTFQLIVRGKVGEVLDA